MDKGQKLRRPPRVVRIIEASPLTAPKPPRPHKKPESSGGGSGRGRRRVKHRETRCLTVGHNDTNSRGILDICVEFVVTKHRRKHRRSKDAAVNGSGDRSIGDGSCGDGGSLGKPETAVSNSQLTVHSQTVLPYFGNCLTLGWTVASVMKPVSSKRSGAAERSYSRSSNSKLDADADSSTVSVQRSEVTDAAMAAKPVVRVGGDHGDEGSTPKRPLHRQSSPTSRSVSQRLQELELLSRCLSQVSSSGGPSEQLIRTRDHLLTLRSLTENALSIIGRYYPTPAQLSQQPTLPLLPPPLPPRAAVESRTFGSQQVQPSEAGAASVNTLDARTSAPSDAGPTGLGKRGAATATVRWQAGPNWDAVGLLSSENWDQSEPYFSACLPEGAPPEAQQLRSCLARRPPRRHSACRIVSHSGRPPIVSRELLKDARFTTAEIRPLRISAVDTLRPPELPQLLAHSTECAKIWLPPEQLASATEVPLSATLYSVCALRRAVPTACNRLASHRVLHPDGQSCRTCSHWLLATTQATAMAIGAAEINVAPIPSTVTAQTVPLAELVSAGRSRSPSSESCTGGVSVTECYAPSLCLRLAVLQMPPDSSARRLRPRILPSPESFADSLGRVDPAPQSQSATTAGLVPLVDEAEEGGAEGKPEGCGNGDRTSAIINSGLSSSLNDACGDVLVLHGGVDKQVQQSTTGDSVLALQTAATYNTVNALHNA